MKKIVSMFLCIIMIASFAVSAEELADSVEVEAIAYEDEPSGDEIILEIENEIESDVELEEELGITTEDKAEIEVAAKGVGIGQFTRNLQLRFKIRHAAITAETIISYLEEKGKDTSELKAILSDINSAFDTIKAAELSKEAFKEQLAKIHELTLKFRETARALIPAEEREALKERISKYLEENKQRLEELREKELRLRELYNKKQFIERLKNVRDHAKEIRQDGKKLLELSDRMKKIIELKKQSETGIDSKKAEEIKQKWMEHAEKFKEESNNADVRNERAKLAIEAAGIRKAISEAEKAGEDTSELEKKYAEIKVGIEAMVPGMVISREARENAQEIKSRIDEVKKDRIVGNRIERIAEKREEIRNDRRKEEIKEKVISGSDVRVGKEKVETRTKVQVGNEKVETRTKIENRMEEKAGIEDSIRDTEQRKDLGNLPLIPEIK